VHRLLAFGVIALGGIVFLSLSFMTAPYGRHARAGWGPTVASRIGWIVMESPAVLAFAAIYALGVDRAAPVPLVLAALWLTHYVHRTFVFPFRMRPGDKRMPIGLLAMAIGFNCINAYLNARWISQLGRYSTSWLEDPRFLVGAALFATGMIVNVHSDQILFSLRKPGDVGYRIPRGGAYRLVSAPNYLGELMEWGGWAVATWSLAGLSFFLFTFANLVPRAISNHRWYKATFPDYPKDRRAVIPFIV
jgi:protein-S-isoprenylcysteine O-methyltransferase Ste14